MNPIKEKITKILDLEKLSGTEREDILIKIGSIIFQNVLARALEKISDKEQDEFEAILDKNADPEEIFEFLIKGEIKKYSYSFLQNNPPNSGPYWASGQEIAIRIIILALLYKVFWQSPHSSFVRKRMLSNAIVAHAQRIPKTLIYARSQDNNHLITEAAGLYTAGILLKDHPCSAQWLKAGWYYFHQAVQNQIDPDGTYTQHSTNYHRLMLQTAIWFFYLSQNDSSIFPAKSLSRLKAASMWLSDILDPLSGHVPNLGNNDGAYLLPLTSCDFQDFRPVVQTAFYVFLGMPYLSDSRFNEMPAWFGFPENLPYHPETLPETQSKTLKVGSANTWATLRSARFSLRAAHADQLHVDMWAYGHNILCDAGTYSYNDSSPWDNRLTSTSVHNTVQINNQDQMTRAGKFLWLNLAQSRVLLNKPDEVMAEHDGYLSSGWLHRRNLKFEASSVFIITDQIIHTIPIQNEPVFSFHWLLPDWPYSINNLDL